VFWYKVCLYQYNESPDIRGLCELAGRRREGHGLTAFRKRKTAELKAEEVTEKMQRIA
jgi:hypothetical protein